MGGLIRPKHGRKEGEHLNEKCKSQDLNPRPLGFDTILSFIHQPVERKVQTYGEG